MTEAQLAIMPLAETMQLGEVLAKSGFFEDSKQAAQAVVKVLAGREIGIGPIAAMTGIHIIKGKPAIGANLIAAAIKRSGRYNYRIKRHDMTICEIEFLERNGDKWEAVGLSTFTLEDGRKAGTQNLDRFPRNMLFARAISNGARWYTPDIFGGAPVYTPEEMGATVDADGDVIDAVAMTAEGSSRPPHWIDDGETRRKFWAYIARQGMSEAELYTALGVQHVHEFGGSMQDAKARIDAFVAARAQAAAAA